MRHLIRAALAATHVAAVGPVVAETLAKHGVTVQLMPAEAFFLKPLTTALERLSRAAGSQALRNGSQRS